MKTETKPTWYVRKGMRVQGPFTETEVSRFLLIGRIRRDDTVSQDGNNWEPVSQVPELVPDEMLDDVELFKSVKHDAPPFRVAVNMPAAKWWHFDAFEAITWAAMFVSLGAVSACVVLR